MAKYKYDLPFPDSYSDLLKEIVKRANSSKTMTGYYYARSNNSTFVVNIGSQDFSKEVEGNPFFIFETCGFISFYTPDLGGGRAQYFTITPSAFEWVEYQNKNWCRKSLEQHPQIIRDLILAISFLLSLGLTGLQILQALKIMP